MAASEPMSSGPISWADMDALDKGKRSRAGALGLLFYERMITLEIEVDLIWSNRWTLGHFLYLFNGWFAFVWLLFDTIPLTPSGVVKSKVCEILEQHCHDFGLNRVCYRCVIYLLFDDIMTLLTTVAVQVILQIRVWALYDKSRRMSIFLLAITLVEISVMVSLVVVTVLNAKHVQLISTATGCSFVGTLPTAAFLWAPALVVEPILCGLVVWKSFSTLERQWTRNSLYAVLARDSIFAELLASTIIWAKYPIYISLILPWSTALPSLLGNRLLLNMRERVVDGPTETSLHLQTISVSSPIPSGLHFSPYLGPLPKQNDDSPLEMG